MPSSSAAAPLTLAAFLLGATAAPAQAASDQTAAVAAVEQRRIRALIDGDVKTLDEIMDDGVTIVQQSGARPSKAQFLAEQARRDVVFDVFELDENTIRIHGDIAIAAGTYHSRTGPSAPVRGARHLRVYLHRDGAWKLIAQQATEIAPPRSP